MENDEWRTRIEEKLDAVLEMHSKLHSDVEVLKSKMGSIMAVVGIVFAGIVTFVMGFFKVNGHG
jgi:exosome complex RNA-binding protein Rrp4